MTPLNVAIDRLKNSGVKLTPQRYAILEFLFQSMSHPTADDIYQALRGKFPNMSVATIYNSMRMFEEVGLVQKMEFGEAANHFCCLTSQHYHVICKECGKIVNFFYPGLNDEIESFITYNKSFEVNRHHFEVYGTCPECQEKEEGSPFDEEDSLKETTN